MDKQEADLMRDKTMFTAGVGAVALITAFFFGLANAPFGAIAAMIVGLMYFGHKYKKLRASGGVK